MSEISYPHMIKFSGIYGGAAGLTAVAGIWGARYVSALPKLPMIKSVAATEGIIFATSFTALYVRDKLLKTKSSPLSDTVHIAAIIMIGSALVTYSKYMLSDRSVSLLNIASMSVIENIVGLSSALIICKLTENDL